MLRLFKQICCLSLLAAAVQSASAFSLLGPIGVEPWQQPVIGYALGGDVGTPRVPGDQYRWNTPVVYYAFDESFISYFGTNGMNAVRQGMTIINNLTNLSSYSTNLQEFPEDSQRFNYQAQALNMLDLKSTAMGFVLEQLGLAEPARYVWTIHDRITQPGRSCPFMIYSVVQRNLDSSSVGGQYTSYINGVLYDYFIVEFCTGPNPLAVTINFAVDPLASTPSDVVDNLIYGFALGRYYTGLTRDDVGGLRYLMATNRVVFEAVDTNSLQILTNQTIPQVLTTTNLALFSSQALTNNQAALQALYPNLLILSVSNLFVEVSVTNITAFLTNFPNSPAGQSTLVFVTNIVPTFVQEFSYVFGNVVTNHQYSSGYISFQTNTVYFPPNAPAGFFVTNVVSSTILTAMTNGDIYIIPTNFCGFDFPEFISGFKNGIPTVQTNTNVVVIALNIAGVSNVISSSFNALTYFTNYTYLVYPIQCLTNTSDLRAGIDKITFVEVQFDSLLGTFFQPITNTYNLAAITNGGPFFTENFRRTVTRPDFLFSTEETINNPLSTEVYAHTTPNWNTNNIRDVAGPGTISAQAVVSFSKVGTVLINTYFPGFFLNALSLVDGITNYVWGSFDGTTNAPILYPDGSSINNLENQVLLQLINPTLPNAQNGVAYNYKFQALGGQPPYRWSLALVSAGLPKGLTLSSDGIISGTPQGASANEIFDFVVELKDVTGRTADYPVSIEFSP